MTSLLQSWASRTTDSPSRPLRVLCTLVFVLLSKTHVCATKDNDNYLIQEHETPHKRQELVPYPRIGRSSNDIQELLLSLREESLTAKDKNKYQPGKKKHQSMDQDQALSEYMVPYLRPGRADNTDDPPPENSNNNNDDDPDEDTMIPYPRFGRSTSRFSYNSHPKTLQSFFYKRNADDETLIPYPRFGKRMSVLDYIWPSSENGDSNRDAEDYQNDLLKSYLEGDGDYITPYPRMGKRSLTSIPQVRFGKKSLVNELMTPYPRFGKRQMEDLVIPYPRMGRSFKLTNSLYSPGKISVNRNRKSDDVDDDMNLMLPLPRFGRSLDKLETKGKNVPLKVGVARQDRLGFHRSGAGINSWISDKVAAHESYPRGRAKRSLMVSENGLRMPSEGRGMVTYRVFAKKDDQSKSSSRKQNSNSKHLNEYPYDMEEQHYMLPYMRPGRSNIEDIDLID